MMWGGDKVSVLIAGRTGSRRRMNLQWFICLSIPPCAPETERQAHGRVVNLTRLLDASLLCPPPHPSSWTGRSTSRTLAELAPAGLTAWFKSSYPTLKFSPDWLEGCLSYLLVRPLPPLPRCN
jgi:hypothetical protein